MLWFSSSIAIVAGLAGLASAQHDGDLSPPSYPSPWMRGGNGWEHAYAKAQQFVSQLTLLEKINLTTGVGWEGEACVGNTGSIPRLNFAGLCLQDSPLGIRFADLNSAFPSGMNAAATWTTRLFKSRGVAMGEEHRGKGIDVQLGPVAGPLGRVPAGGRNWEGFSPDPVLTGIAMSETIKGIQDAGVVACAKHYIMNEQEHNRSPNGSVKYAYSANLDDKTMHELYLWPFADAVRAGVGSIMSSYNQINNSYGSQNSWTLNYLLKNELDFQGFVVSDWWAQHTGVASALAGLDMTMAGDQDLASGNTYWGGNLTAAVLNGTIPQWRLDDMVTRIMSAYFKVGRDAARVPTNFNSWSSETFGYIHPQANEGYQQINYHVNVQDDHARLCREIAGASTVLLKNVKNTLPLKKPKSIAVIGEDAHDNPGGPNSCGDRGCNQGTLAMGWGSGTANFPYLIAPNTALKAQAASHGTKYANVSDNYNLAAVTAAVQGTDAAIVFANADSGEAYISVDGNTGDRNNLTLWGNGDALIAHVASIHPNTIVVLHTVGAVIVEKFKQHPNITALLWAGLPGQESGNAITDILYGKRNPSAKNVFTWGKKREDWGVDVVYTPTADPPQLNFNEGNFIDYRYFDKNGIEPSYEFGFGLSYTTFAYSNLRIVKHNPGPYKPTVGKTRPAPTFGTIDYNVRNAEFPPGFHAVNKYIYPYLSDPVPTGLPQNWPKGAMDGSPQPKLPAGGSGGGNRQLYDVVYVVSATVTNTGRVKGTEIPQLYLSLGGPADPVVALRGFDDLILDPKESATFEVKLTRRDISNWDPVSQNWVVSSYPKTVYVGSSSRNLPLKGALK
ncbi:putative beta-glucosidase A [Dactylonectria macrodidyma]|uniref:beta-glucosidase n=1 Tax=Dactylonectria macrodidyma TaxID=307937 RepID=A0A9P9DGZ6_9HYPO|nr:putative beta-glucosidase A [Dactylonectria macrodidyma]